MKPDEIYRPFDDLYRKIDEQEAAEYLGLSPRTLQAWRTRGGGPPFCKIGRAVRYDRKSLDEWTTARRYTSTAAVSAA